MNNLYDATVPPTVKTDFAFYGGIYRSVSLLIPNTTFVSDMYWTTPNVTAAQARRRSFTAKLQTRIIVHYN